MYGIPPDELPTQQQEAFAVDEDMLWKEIQRMSHEIAYADSPPTPLGAALCGAVVRAREAIQRAEQAGAALKAEREKTIEACEKYLHETCQGSICGLKRQQQDSLTTEPRHE